MKWRKGMRKENRRRATADQTSDRRDTAGDLVRTTLFLTKAQSISFDLLALQEDRPKGELLREAVAGYLKNNRPDASRLESLINAHRV